MEQAVQRKLSELMEMQFDELRQLEAVSMERFISGKSRLLLTIWKEMKSENEVEIVVQAYRPWFLGLGKMYAEGFRMMCTGGRRELEESELYEYS